MKNTYRVNKKRWNTWSELAKYVFNSLYLAMTDNPEVYWHPKAEKINPKFWKTTAWNASWIAADAVDEFKK